MIQREMGRVGNEGATKFLQTTYYAKGTCFMGNVPNISKNGYFLVISVVSLEISSIRITNYFCVFLCISYVLYGTWLLRVFLLLYFILLL